MELNENSKLTPSLLIAFVLSDIEIFLLQNESQTDYKEQDAFTRDEIMNQLHQTGMKMLNVLKDSGEVKLFEPIDVYKSANFNCQVLKSNLINPK
jgi:hypothetical protein